MKGRRRKKPENWYTFRTHCDLWQLGVVDGMLSNLSPPSQQEYCKRNPANGKPRSKGEPLICAWWVCPKIPLEK